MPQELPKISGVTRRLIIPEGRFESMVKKATGLELPPGPQSVLLKVQRGVEVGKPPAVEEVIPEPPKLEAILERLPELPKMEGVLEGIEKKVTEEKEVAEEKVVTKAGYTPIQ